MATGVVFTEELKRHDPGAGHPDSPARIDAVARALEDGSLAGRLREIPPRRAVREEILLVHWDRLYREVAESASREQTFLDPDTVTSPETAEVAHLATGSVLAAVEAVMEAEVDNAFALSRPPGHHAKPDKAMGFCLFNHVAIAAKLAQKRFQLDRILVIDFDVHHGNGTQKAFYTSPEVLYVSTHQWPHYPGTGAVEEVGKDEGEGFTLNVPMPAGMGDDEILRIFRDVVLPVGREFAPELILVSAGFDAHRDDPLGGMRLTGSGFAELAGEIQALADETCGGKTIYALEGGYDPGALTESVAAVLGVLAGDRPARRDPAEGAARELVGQIRAAHAAYWTSLAG